MRILLAEDNPANEYVARLLLKELGHTSHSARNGREVLDLLQSGEEFDVILMDIQMPEMDGLEATRRLCEQFPDAERRPPVIAVTANAFQSDRDACREAGMVGFLAKPLRLATLREALTGVGDAPDRGSEAAEPEFDFEHFDLLMEGGDEEAVEIFEDFCEATVSLLDEMLELAQASRTEDLAGLAHQLKGSLATFGMAALSREMSDLEVRARAGLLSMVDAAWRDRQLASFGAAVEVLRARI